MNLLTPHNDLSKQLFASIPKKAFTWLESLGEDLSVPGGYGRLNWEFAPEGGRLQLDQTEYEAPPIIIEWEGEPANITKIAGSDPRFAFIDLNLKWFADIEQKIYDEIEALQEQIQLASAYEFAKPEAR
jgi:hypothetical protein